MDPKYLRKSLLRIVDLLADEAERNPEFAASLAHALGLSSAPSRLQARSMQTESASDPFEVFGARGAEGFRAWLNERSIAELRSIVREHRFDPSRLSDQWKTKERFIKLISERVETRSRQGDVFRHYGTKGDDITNPDAEPDAK